MNEIRITDPTTGAQKGQKLERYDLIPFDALDEVARVYGIGARKYADRNWEKGYAWGLSIGALGRHIARFAMGENVDPETGCPHLAHAAWHCLTLLAYMKRKIGTDDRTVPAAHVRTDWSEPVAVKHKPGCDGGHLGACDFDPKHPGRGC